MRLAGLLCLLMTTASCMEMHETVERMVMVRTTGSDLEPAATGFIYKKEHDGKESVIEMGKSEVEKHLSKLYEPPQAYAAPVPTAAGPFYAKDGDDAQAASDATEHIIPVVEEQESDKKVDGIADEDYDKVIKDYASNAQKYNRNIKDYLFGHFHNKNNLDTKQDEAGNKKEQEKNNEQDFHTEKYESYSISEKGDYAKKVGESDDFRKESPADDIKDKTIDEYHKFFVNEYKKGLGFYGKADEGNFGEFGDGFYYGEPTGEFSEDSNDEYKGLKKELYAGVSGDSHSVPDPHHHDHASYYGDIASEGGYHGKGFRYDIKH